MKKLTTPLIALLATVGMTFVFCMSFSAGVAHAQAADAGSAIGSGSAVDLPAPVATAAPDVSISTMEKLYHSGAFFCLGIVVLFVGLRLADSKISWLQQGKRGSYVAAALGGLALLVAPAAQGSTPNMSMLTSALATAIALLVNPTKATGTA